MSRANTTRLNSLKSKEKDVSKKKKFSIYMAPLRPKTQALGRQRAKPSKIKARYSQPTCRNCSYLCAPYNSTQYCNTETVFIYIPVPPDHISDVRPHLRCGQVEVRGPLIPFSSGVQGMQWCSPHGQALALRPYFMALDLKVSRGSCVAIFRHHPQTLGPTTTGKVKSLSMSII